MLVLCSVQGIAVVAVVILAGIVTVLNKIKQRQLR